MSKLLLSNKAFECIHIDFLKCNRSNCLSQTPLNINHCARNRLNQEVSYVLSSKEDSRLFNIHSAWRIRINENVVENTFNISTVVLKYRNMTDRVRNR